MISSLQVAFYYEVNEFISIISICLKILGEKKNNHYLKGPCMGCS